MMAAMVSMLASCGGNGAKKAEAPADDANVVVLFDGTSLDGWRGLRPLRLHPARSHAGGVAR